MDMNDISYILECAAGNLYFILPVLLLSGAAAFLAGLVVIGRKKNTAIRFIPLMIAELILFLVMLPYLIRWIGIQSFTWGFWYEGGLEFYLPFSGMVGILIGYLLGIALKKKV